MSVTDSPLIRVAENLWEEATTARFLTAIGDGSLPDEALDRWLVQDRIFASELFRFQSILLGKVPESARRPVLGGLVAIDAELSWFGELWRQRGLEPAEPHPVCARYTDFLLHAAYTDPASRLLQILYGVEVSYFAAWSALAEGELPAGIHGKLIARWSNQEFEAYVGMLKELTERHHHPDDAGFRRVLELERDFWRMTWEG
jgi:thiaminase/transcriptional activator TenA